MCAFVYRLLVAGRVPFTAAQGNTDDTAWKGDIQAVCVFVHVQREDTLVILTVRQAPGKREAGNMIRGLSDKSVYCFSLGRFNHLLGGEAHKAFSSQFNKIVTSDTLQLVYSYPKINREKSPYTHCSCTEGRQTGSAICARKPHFKSCWLLGQKAEGEGKQRTEADSESVKSVCIPTWPCWRHLSPPEAGCRSATQRWSWPKPWGQPLTRPRWTPLCSSCEVLLHCPQPALSVCTFTHSRGACVTHSRGAK